MWREYANKHLLKLEQSKLLFVSSILAASAMFSGCENKVQQTESELPSVDTLFQPYSGKDYYGTNVELYPVEVPLYAKDGSLLKDRYNTVYALNPVDYQAPDENLKSRVIPASYGTESNVLYVLADKYNRVITDKGLVGLVVIDGKLQLISNKNKSAYINELELNNQKKKRPETRKTKKDSIPVVLTTDSSTYTKDTISDSPKAMVDSANVVTKMLSDTLLTH